ncbi:MAG: GNAT family N-acetyltransferase [Candidatus Marinimicrobia bacterium]|nr:GNAT family N-acetyltransferase [Candidatus Neomarinimicrobiota bacterium]
METVTLREITKTTYREILNLKVGENQKQFVAANAVSLAQANFHPEAWFRGVYAGDTAVGFAMLEIDTEKPEYYLWRFMIDEKHQSKGYGYQAMELLIRHVRTLPRATEFLLSYVPAQGSPREFYQKLGFEDTGEVEDGENIMRLELR